MTSLYCPTYVWSSGSLMTSLYCPTFVWSSGSLMTIRYIFNFNLKSILFYEIPVSFQQLDNAACTRRAMPLSIVPSTLDVGCVLSVCKQTFCFRRQTFCFRRQAFCFRRQTFCFRHIILQNIAHQGIAPWFSLSWAPIAVASMVAKRYSVIASKRTYIQV